MAVKRRTNSILEVAREANVSPSTVSLVVNRHPRVSREMRERVESVIRRMGYRPRSVRNRRRHVAVLYGRGMMFCGELVNYCREWIAGIRSGLGDDGGDVSVFRGEADVATDLMFEAGLSSGDFDGLVVMGVHPHDGYLRRVVDAGVPLVAMNRLPEFTEFSSVCLDHRAAGEMVAEHLIGLGHRRVGLFMGKQDVYPANVLSRSFLDRLRLKGREPVFHREDPSLTFDDLAAFDRHARGIVDSGVTAVFAGDPLAYRLANALEALGVDVPGQISVVGIDNLGLETDAGRRLTSIDYDKQMMGRLAGQMLQNLLSMEGGLTNMTANVSPQLYKGQTAGPPPAWGRAAR